MSDDGRGPRRRRIRGVIGLTLTRLWKQATRTTSGRLVATLAGVALTVAMLLLVTGVAIALAGGGVATADDADVRITPDGETVVSSVNGVEGTRLGAASERAESIRSEEGVEHASPVLVEPTTLEPIDGGESAILVLVGVVPDDEPRTVAGLSTAALDTNNRRQIVLSETAADRFDGDAERLVRASYRSDGDTAFTVTATEPSTVEDAPVVLVHLDDLQALSGAADDDLADQMLVWGDRDAAAAAGADAYPDAAVERTGAASPASLFDDELAFVTSLLALVVGIGICASFITTTMGMTVDEDRRVLAVLEAIGFPAYSRLAVVAVSTLVTTLVGAIVGIALGWVGIYAANSLAGATVAAVHPLFVPYAIGVALIAGLLAVPYPLVVAARTTVLEEVGR